MRIIFRVWYFNKIIRVSISKDNSSNKRNKGRKRDYYIVRCDTNLNIGIVAIVCTQHDYMRQLTHIMVEYRILQRGHYPQKCRRRFSLFCKNTTHSWILATNWILNNGRNWTTHWQSMHAEHPAKADSKLACMKHHAHRSPHPEPKMKTTKWEGKNETKAPKTDGQVAPTRNILWQSLSTL